jgi:DNA replication protein DnaC
VIEIQHLSEVVKILEAAVRHDPTQAVNYALLLADKLEQEGSARQAQLVRKELAKGPARSVSSANAFESPVDSDTQLPTVDVVIPSAHDGELFLTRSTRERVADFITSVESSDIFSAKGIASNNRLLLHGAPGTGKSSIASRIAFDLDLPLVTTRSDALVSSLLGQTSRNIRNVFEYASRHPCVLFLDEFDALAKDRSDSREVGELQRVVIALLQNMDALSPATVLIAATNHPQLLDRAVWRRFDHTIVVDLPEMSERSAIWESRLSSVRTYPDEIEILASASAGLSGSAIQTAAFDIARRELIDGSDALRLPNALRRLARFIWYEDFAVFNDEAKEVCALRRWQPKVFTIRALAGVFGLSTKRIGTYLTLGGIDGSESDTFAAIQGTGTR